METNQKRWIAVIAILGLVGALAYFKVRDRNQLAGGSASTQPTEMSDSFLANDTRTASPEIKATGVEGNLATGSANQTGVAANKVQHDSKEAEQTASTQSPKAESPKPEVQACLTREFAHEDMASHRDGQLCLDHNNTIALKDLPAKPLSVCVRVNDRVVSSRLEKKGSEFEVHFGSEAGPKSIVRVSACFTKGKCDPCKVTKDRFLSSLGVDEAEAAGSNDKVEQEYSKLQKALGEDKELASDFHGWKQKSESASCSIQ